jgi:hypothetical protein
MPINSAQDITTALKRSVVSKTIKTNPPAGKNRIPSTYTSIFAHEADQFKLVVKVGGGEQLTTTCCATGTSTLPGSAI